MIKRIIACLTICLIITGLISPVFSHAEPIPIYTPNWDNPGIAEIINISDLTGWMANGGVYDITSFQNLDEFLTWYFKIRVPVKDEDGNITFAPTYGYDSYLDSNYTSPRFIEQSNIRGMISRSYQNKTGYGRRLQEQVDKALIDDGDLSNVNIPLLNLSEAALFVGYNTNAIQFYENSFNNSDIQEPNPDLNYIDYLDRLNKREHQSRYFWWFDCNEIYQRSNYYGLTHFPTTSYSWWTSSNNSYGSGFGSDSAVQHCSELLTLNINSSNNVYYLNITVDSYNPISWVNAYRPEPSTYYNAVSFRVNNSTDVWPDGRGDNITSFNFSVSGTLSQVLDYCCLHFKNVNVYVDGIPWAYANIPNPIVPEFPDVVGGDELPITTWPLTVPKVPSYINLPGLRQAFQRAKTTDNQFDILDLTDSLVDPDGDPIEDPEMETVPIPLPNPDPINPEVVPELPDLPLIPPANNPGFSGVSVLAEIINFTNQSLPSALITVFWGIVFGAVILGIIKILHK